MSFRSGLTLVAGLVVCCWVWAGPGPAGDRAGAQHAPGYPAPHEPLPRDLRPPPLGPRRTAPPAVVRLGRYVSVQVNVDEFGNNIVGDAANEPSLAIDPRYPGRMAIGWRQFDTIESDFRQAGWAFSRDAGQNWTFPGVLEPGVFRSDPVLAADADGNFYYYSLAPSADWTYHMFKSTDGGVSWSEPVFAYGGDKGWMAIDRTGGIGHGNIYLTWSGHPDFTRSTDGGLTYMEPITIPGTPIFGTVTVGPEGEVYVVGNDGFARSSNAQDPLAVPEFELDTYVDLGGEYPAGNIGPNPDGLLGQVWVACDHSGGPNHGNVYVLCSTYFFESNELDVMFARSTDGGETWSEPVRINDDPPGSGAWQWFGTMSVAPNGRIDVIWNDTRNGESYWWSQVFYSYSTDGGLTWSENEAITPPFDSSLGWPVQHKLGDYYHMISDNAGANLAYAATFNGEQDVYFLRIGPRDCNENGVPDDEDIAAGTSGDCNENVVPDECEPGLDQDCNDNGVPDLCDIGTGASDDCNWNDIPDECEPGWDQDCNGNGMADLCDIYAGTSQDCNGNSVPDECDIAAGTSDDCNLNGIPDECELGWDQDCNENGVPDLCEPGWGGDCNDNGVADFCDLYAGTSQDCNENVIPDECEPTPAHDDCADAAIICPNLSYTGNTAEATSDGSASCGDSDGAPDVWYYYQPYGTGQATVSLCGSSFDTVVSVHDGCPGTVENEIACNDDTCYEQSQVSFLALPGHSYWIRVAGKNGAAGPFEMFFTGPLCAYGPDCNDNGVLDECEPDCNGNGRPDDCDIADGTSLDEDGDGIPDECEILGDVNCDGAVDEADVDPFVLALVDPAGYADAHPGCPLDNADANGDGELNAFDIDPFVALLTGG